jgi:ferric-chelate reductase [NAD(P)H]
MTPQTVDRKAFRDLSYGLYLLTSCEEDRMNGQLINTAIQVTSDPPRVAVIVNKENLTHEFIQKSGVFSISVLEESAPMSFFGPFGFRSGRDFDKFAKVPYRKGLTGSPLVIDFSLSVLEARVFHQVDLGTHTVFVGNIVGSEVLKEGRPLTYRYYHEQLKGKASPKAPTFSA